MFDHLFAVASGQCIYTGAPYNVVPFLFEVGLKCPPFHNPADYCKYICLFVSEDKWTLTNPLLYVLLSFFFLLYCILFFIHASHSIRNIDK